MFAADATHPNTALQGKLNHIYTLKKSGRIDLTIRSEYFTLLDRLGNPHKKLPPVIHVAGTNGKGSTIAFMRAILEAAGHRVHVYTSPHLIRFNERIVLAGADISDAALESLLDEVLAANDGMEQTFFEITTALAFTAFARIPADIVLLETGLGGRLDSTNVIDRPLATIITALSYDHMEFLGPTIESITAEKAGIIKPDTPCIIAPQLYPATLPVLRDHARRLNAPFYAQHEGWTMTGSADSPHGPFAVQAGTRRLNDLPTPSLLGAHQVRNAMTAIAALMIQTQIPIPDEAFSKGLRSAHWPARLQRLSLETPAGWDIWLDGGHNDSAGAVLADQARVWAAQDGKPLYIITGMLAHKDAAAFAQNLAPLTARVITLALPGHAETSFPPDALAQIWTEAGASSATPSSAPFAALLAEIMARNPPGRILVTGSLYLAQEIG